MNWLTDDENSSDEEVEVKTSKKNKKEQEIYGIFASDNEEPVKADKTNWKQMSFVETTSVDEEKDETEELDQAKHQVEEMDKETNRNDLETKEDSDKMEIDEVEMPLKFGSSSKSNMRQRQKAQMNNKKREMKNVEPQFGEFEKHTKGIGLKLLMKMGYKPGKGLGAEGSGLVNPIEAVIRPKKQGLGFADEKVVDSSSSKQVLEKEIPLQGWKKKKKKTENNFKSVAQLLKEAGDIPSMKIIDMTGRDAKEVSSASIKQELQSSRLIELRHNMRLLENMCESKIINSNRELEKTKYNLDSLRVEQSTIKKHLSQVTSNLDLQRKLKKQMKEIQRKCKTFGNTISLENITEMGQLLMKEFSSLSNSLITGFLFSCIGPLVSRHFNDWSIIEDPLLGHSCFKIWNNWCEPIKPQKSRDMNRYESMLFHYWVPKVRSSLQSDWDIEDSSDKIIYFLEEWKPVIPFFIYQDTILDQVIVPRLLDWVEDYPWKEKTSKYLSLIIIPWLPVLGSFLQPMHAQIRHQLSKLLDDWDPCTEDSEEKIKLIEPWSQVFSVVEMNAFLDRHVVPKLSYLMNAFQVNPSNQQMQFLKSFLSWIALVPEQTLSGILSYTFFPKWLKILYMWLTSSDPDYDDITEWYLSWKQQFPSEWVASDKNVSYFFTKGLDMMNQLLVDPSIPFETFNKPPQITNNNLKQSSLPVNETVNLTFKQLLERMAEENQLLLISTNRAHPINGRPLYSLGKLLIYLSDDVAYLYEKNVPIGLQDLIETALNKR